MLSAGFISYVGKDSPVLLIFCYNNGPALIIFYGKAGIQIRVSMKSTGHAKKKAVIMDGRWVIL
jgi:hypothetical protein